MQPITVIEDDNYSITTISGAVIVCKPSYKQFKVYAVFCLTTKKIYFGYTKKSLKNRSRYRANNANRKIRKGEKLSRFDKDIIEIGSDQFVMFEVDGFENEKSATDREKQLIEEYETRNTEKGYNTSRGGSCGFVMGPEQLAIQLSNIRKIHEFRKDHGCYPKEGGEISGEHTLAVARSRLKQIYKGNREDGIVFHESYKLIKELNMDDFFESKNKKPEDLVANQLSTITKIYEFRKIHGCYPKHGSKIEGGVTLARVHNYLKQAYKGNIKDGTIYPASYELIQELKMDDFFECESRKPEDLVAKQLSAVKKIYEFRKDHGCYPKEGGEISGEHTLAKTHSYLKQVNKGNNKDGNIYPESYGLIQELKLNDFFECEDLVANQLSTIKKIHEFRKAHGCYPKRGGEISGEATLAGAHNTLKQIHKGNAKRGNIYSESYDLIQELKMDEFFECESRKPEDLVANQLSAIKKIHEFRKIHGCYPKRRGKISGEHTLARAHDRLKQVRNGNRDGNIYPASYELIKELNMHDFFSPPDRRKKPKPLS